MMVLVSCPSCEDRFVRSCPGDENVLKGTCPECGGVVTAEPEEQTTVADAAQEGALSKVKRLLEAGADPAATDEDGQAPLHRAAKEGHREIVELLLDG